MRAAVLRTALAGCLAALVPAATLAETFTFGIVPQQSASRLAQMWGPLLQELETRTGHQFQFRTTKDIPTFEACLTEGAFDLAYMNPMHYAVFSQASGYRAIAHQSGKRLKGILVARKDANIGELSELDGGQVAFPSPGAFGASVLPRAALTEMQVRFDPAYVKSHDSVYMAVAAGIMPAGGGVLRTFGAIDAEIRDQLQVIYETESFTPHAIAVSGTVSGDLEHLFQTTLMAIAADRPELVTGVGMKGFTEAADADWDDVRALDMAQSETGINLEGGAACPSG